jgi:hypothetical protein
LVLESLLQNNLIRREMQGYDHRVLQQTVDEVGQLNEGQKAIYHTIIDAAEAWSPGNNMFFIDGPGGTTRRGVTVAQALDLSLAHGGALESKEREQRTQRESGQS